jgi:hypothetical protein
MLLDFLAGANAMGFLIIGLFFLRFWKKTGDQLFLAFAGAFWLLGAGQALLTLGAVPIEERSVIFLLRLAAFVLILVAIWRKNARAS